MTHSTKEWSKRRRRKEQSLDAGSIAPVEISSSKLPQEADGDRLCTPEEDFRCRTVASTASFPRGITRLQPELFFLLPGKDQGCLLQLHSSAFVVKLVSPPLPSRAPPD